ncbi:uncharacterized protein LOC141604969 [Silene latifolia]|uniref:uncharacterized protein LOC141604969 n=1 Tax=Silene latifolia TaxID=37657 RepID=UPI003D770F40
MAAAEARAAWQRANRYFVQEDAKRAPKLSTRQSSTLSSKQTDSGPVNDAEHPNHSAIGFMPYSGTPYSNLPPDAKWWLQTQPNYVHQRGLNADHFTDRKIDMIGSPSQVEPSSMCEDSIHTVHYEDVESFLDVNKKPELGLEELNVVDNKVDQDFLDLKKMTDYYELIEMEMVGGSVSKQSSNLSSSADSSWVGGDKVPWWRVTDGEELASFVAHKSLHHVENCDLPPPQKMKVRGETCKQGKSTVHDDICTASLECEFQSEAISSPSFDGSQRRHRSSVKGELSPNENLADEPLRSSNHIPLDKERVPVNDPEKAKLLEALCHSQTRAREAENAAKQACTEKDHILKLFFRQASQLFAYKQWFKILQLENLLLQTENQNSSPHPLPCRTENPKTYKSWQKPSKAKRHRRGSQDNDIGKYAVVFAVGFTLVGAGLILGWTVGWLMPSF